MKPKIEQAKLFEIDVIKKFERSNATVSELRTGIFAPIEKISSKSATYLNFVKNKRQREITTSWGSVKIKGNILTQTHRDILDCIFANAKMIKELQSGEVAVYFSISQVLKGYGDSGKNDKWLKEKLNEIRTTAIEVKLQDGSWFDFNLLNEAAFSVRHQNFGIVISEKYKRFFENQLSVNYKNELPKLLKIDSALLKAIVRFFFTHTNSNMDLEDLLKTIGFPIDSLRTLQRAKKEIKDNQELLKEFGIEIVGRNVLSYKKQGYENTITFVRPVTNKSQPKLLSDEDIE